MTCQLCVLSVSKTNWSVLFIHKTWWRIYWGYLQTLEGSQDNLNHEASLEGRAHVLGAQAFGGGGMDLDFPSEPLFSDKQV